MREELDMAYLARFDDGGVCRAIYLAGTKNAGEAAGCVEISDEEWAYYIGNRGAGDNGTGYIRDPKTGKPVSAPPAPAVPDVPAEPVVDDVRLAAFEAMAEQEARLITYSERLATLEAALKGGEGK